jgi:hypothetical protein
MSYKQIKQYGYRDSLESGDPEKVIYGADFDGEFNAIEVAMEKIVGDDLDVDIDDVEGLQAALDDKADKADLDDKADADHTHEIAEVSGLQDALDNAGGGGSGVIIADSPPANPSSGDMWFNSTPNEGALYIYDGSVWFSSLSVDADI